MPHLPEYGMHGTNGYCNISNVVALNGQRIMFPVTHHYKQVFRVVHSHSPCYLKGEPSDAVTGYSPQGACIYCNDHLPLLSGNYKCGN